MAPVITSPRPQFSSEGRYLPLEPPLGQQRSTARSQRFKRHSTTRRSRSERPECYHNRRYPHDVKRPGIEQPSLPTDVPPHTDQTPRNDPIGPGPRTPDRRDGQRRTRPTHRVPMTHEAAPPSRPRTRRSAAVTPEQKSTSRSAAVGPSRQDAATTAGDAVTNPNNRPQTKRLTTPSNASGRRFRMTPGASTGAERRSGG